MQSSYKFCQAHPNLEHLRIESGGGDLLPPFASVAVCKLQKLESFNCGRHYISKGVILFTRKLFIKKLLNFFIFYTEFVEGMAEAYPILKILRLTTYLATLPADGKAVFSAFRFPHLTTLSLCNLQLLDGSALISVKSKFSLNYNNVFEFIIILYFYLFLDHQRMPEAGDCAPGNRYPGFIFFRIKLGTISPFGYQTA